MEVRRMILVFMTSCFIGNSLSSSIDRHSFPDDFVFGTAASAFQYEGATNEGGKSETIWDHFSHTYPERTNMDNADVALDFYHRYKDDIKLMKELNMDAFRFSISWARLLPSGKLKDGVNKEGLQFYKDLIDELLANDIQPSVTLYHWDHPQALEEEYGGFLSPRIIDDFRDFARVCFEEFGDKVKMWSTINEPHIISVAGYDNGNKAVGRCSKWVNSECHAGDSSTEPYIASHHLLLAHAAAVQEFRRCNKTSEDGQIGIVLSPRWFEPYDFTSSADKEAVERALVFEMDWHIDPVIHGDYPELMKKYVGNRLPTFTAEESEMLKNSSDFIGVNYYTTRFTVHLPNLDPSRARFTTDQHLEWRRTNQTGHYIGPWEGRKFLFSYPEGLRKVLNYIKDKYNNPIVIIKENGINDYDDGNTPKEEIMKDTLRIEYHEKHLEQLHKAIVEDGCDVRGYYAWSLLDNFEWEHGYSTRFGLYYVDYDDDLQRYPKDSANWFKQFLKSRDDDDEDEFQVMSREESREGWNTTLLETSVVSSSSSSSSSSVLSSMVNRSWRGERDQCAFFDNSSGGFGLLWGLQNSLAY